MATDLGSTIQPAGPQHETLTAWSQKRGVKIHDSIQPARVSGRGLGIIAHRRIEAGEELVNVPASALLTEESIPREFKKKLGGITVHGLLASFLAIGGAATESYAPWQATWPSMADFRACMPILWPEKLRTRLDVDAHGYENICSLLAPAIGNGRWAHDSLAGFGERMSRGLLHQQEEKFRRDWETVERVFSEADRDTYLYCWLVVNTRSFYFELPGLKETRPKEDHMVLCPFVDYFNHADHGCDVTFDETGYTVTADRVYDAGEEIYVSYGSHSNDFLLVEYGFILETNKWDSLPIDDLLVPNVLKHKLRRNRLENAGYLGNYRLTSEGVCYRTQVAVRAGTLGHQDWKRFLRGQNLSEEARDRDEFQADAFVAAQILQVYLREAKEALKALAKMDDEGVQSQKETLVKRWMQIRDMIRQARENGISPSVRNNLDYWEGSEDSE